LENTGWSFSGNRLVVMDVEMIKSISGKRVMGRRLRYWRYFSWWDCSRCSPRTAI